MTYYRVVQLADNGEELMSATCLSLSEARRTAEVMADTTNPVTIQIWEVHTT